MIRKIALVAMTALAIPAAAMAQETLKIGHLAVSGGPFVTAARGNGIAVQMAVDEINSAGGVNGIPLEIVSFDTAGDPAQAVVGFRRLAQDDGVLAVVGPFSSGEARVVFPQADRLGLVSMSMGSSAPKLAEPFDYAFRNTTNEALMFNAVLSTLSERPDYELNSATIAYATDDAVSVALGEKIFPALFKKYAIPVTDKVTFKYAAFDMSVQVAELSAAPSDVVAVGAPSEAAIKVVKEMRRQGHDGRMIASSTIFDVDLPERMGEAGIGAVMPTSFYWDEDERTREFSAEFRARAEAAGLPSSVPSQFDAASYTIVKLFAHAMEDAGVTGKPERLAEERAAIQKAMLGIQDFDAVEGILNIGPDGDVIKPIYVMEITRDGWSMLDAR
jgi:branched-chain amino acid transport system substrate-binding protein